MNILIVEDELHTANLLKEIIEEKRRILEGGITLSKCFEKYLKIFDKIYINLIKAGEASGNLDDSWLNLVVSLRKERK